MSLLDKVRSALGSQPASRGLRPSDLYPIKVRCRRCQEILTTQINLANDLSLDYERDVYTVRKVLMGAGQNRCFERIEVQLTFDRNRRLLEQEIVGGVFVEDEV